MFTFSVVTMPGSIRNCIHIAVQMSAFGLPYQFCATETIGSVAQTGFVLPIQTLHASLWDFE